MDIFLINPYAQESIGTNETTVEVPVGLLCLASFLESKGLKVGFLDANAMQIPRHKVIEIIREKKPRVVGISVNIFTFLQAIQYTEEIKNILKYTTVIWGGPHPTAAPDLCLKKSKADFLVTGEGELSLLDSMECILRNGNLETINGIAYRKGSDIAVNPPRQRIANLDILPLPAYHLLPDLKYYKTRARKKPFMGIVTSRGCPFNCIYCSKDVFKSSITMRSPENIMDEIDLLVSKYKIRQLDILDDNFTIDKRRVERLCELILNRKYRLCINLQGGIRADKVDESLIKKMKKAGVFKLGMGVETANKAISKVIKKDLDLNKALETAHLARKHGIIVLGFFMIGLPGDNEDTLQETIDFAIKMNPHFANFTMTIPFYGTELYRIIEKEGRFLFDTKEGIWYGFYATKPYYELGTLSAEIMVKFYKRAYRQFYFRFGKIIDLILTIRSFNELGWIMQTSFNVCRFFFTAAR